MCGNCAQVFRLALSACVSGLFPAGAVLKKKIKCLDNLFFRFKLAVHARLRAGDEGVAGFLCLAIVASLAPLLQF